jgi:hypothetical protein
VQFFPLQQPGTAQPPANQQHSVSIVLASKPAGPAQQQQPSGPEAQMAIPAPTITSPAGFQLRPTAPRGIPTLPQRAGDAAAQQASPGHKNVPYAPAAAPNLALPGIPAAIQPFQAAGQQLLQQGSVPNTAAMQPAGNARQESPSQQQPAGGGLPNGTVNA